MKFVLLLTFIAASFGHPKYKIDPLSDEFIDIINNKQSTWTAGRNFQADFGSRIHSLVGSLKNPNKTLPIKVHEIGERAILPTFFDARVHWGDCNSIKEIRDQAACGSCWAFGAVEAMSDRICIHSQGKKQVSVSAEDLMSCCGFSCGLGCYGGYPDSAWYYWAEHGIVTGGEYGSQKGCKPYSIEPCAHFTQYTTSTKPACGEAALTPVCVSSCGTPSLSYKDELTFGEVVYSIQTNEDQIKMEIMTHGPVEAAFDVYEDFLSYKTGVYQNIGGDELGGHAVKLLGWGVENGTDYWIAANSWGEDWGDNGYFKILRGVNHVKIESEIVAGLPKF